MPIRADSLDIMLCRISQMVGRIISDASEVLCPSQRALRSIAFSDLHGHRGMLQREGCSDAVAQVARKCQIPHTVLLFSHRPWMESKQIGLSPSLSRRIWQTQTYILPRAVQVYLAVRNSACAELQIYIMYEEMNFPFIIAFICGGFTIKQRPS